MTPRRAYLWTLLSITAGVSLSLYEQDWSWLARGGSLIVVLGIVLTSSQIIEGLQILRQRRLRGEHHHESWSTHDWADEAENHKKLRSDDAEYHGRSHGLYLLILGTLLWGFGDIPGRFL